MKVKAIELVFENLEVIKLKANMFKYLFISGIKTSKYINCYQYKDGEVIENKTCEYFRIEINNEGKKQKGILEESKTLKERINGNDIASICLIYDNDEEETIYVPWNDDDEFTNKYQENKINYHGLLEIVIQEKSFEKCDETL